MTDAIFEQLEAVNRQADVDPSQLRLSLDAKATVKLGPFSRGGKTRAETTGSDHDFKPTGALTPYGIFLPQFDELSLYFTPSNVTSDFMVDMLERWWQAHRHRFPEVTTLVLNQDNGPENQSRRTQFIHRLVAFSQHHQLTVRLAYYPPYHSKYNPIERVWGILEQHWNGAILDEVNTVLNFAQTMTWKGIHPVVELINQVYPTGVKLTQKAMAALEEQLHRLTEVRVDGEWVNLGQWFVDIVPQPEFPQVE